MKIRIIGFIIFVIVMGGIYVISESDGTTSQTPLQSAPGNNDAALKALSL